MKKLKTKLKQMFENRLFFPLLILTIALTFLWSRGVFNPRRPAETVREVSEKAANLVRGGSFSFDENTPGYDNLKNLRQGCPVKDCIPSIDEPKFESIRQADKWLEDMDVVFALEYKGEERVYPQRILNWHEIVNDKVAGDPLAITFCPLCGSSLTFSRVVEGEVLEFGVSGKLHNNDLVMYDRQTESLWQQITGEAIVGEYFGKKLKQIPMDTLRWDEWKKEHPDTQVLSRETGYSRDYSRYPYGDYENNERTLYPVEGGFDRSLHPKEVVFGVEVNDSFKAYPESVLQEDGDGVITDAIGGREIKIEYDDGELSVVDLGSGEELAPVRLFWFAWKAFHPETEIYK